MAFYRCPRGDGGICHRPDGPARNIRVRRGLFYAITSEEADEGIGTWPPEGEPDDLSPIKPDRRAWYALQVEDAPEWLQAVLVGRTIGDVSFGEAVRVSQYANVMDGVIIECTCGDRWIQDRAARP